MSSNAHRNSDRLDVVPKVSVIMNCYNGERFLKEAIDSVYAQTFTDWEIVLWDNGSTDRTAEIARSYDSRLRYFRTEQTVSLGQARKLAWDQASGDWIGFLDSDDYWLPQKLERQMQAVANSKYFLCYGGIREIDIDGHVLREVVPLAASGMILEQLLNQFDINMVTPIVRREAAERYKLGFDPSVTASEGYNLFMRLAANGAFCAIPEVLGVWRIWPGTLTARQISKWADERFYTLDQVERDHPGIAERFPAAFAEARARGTYYRVRYLVSEGRYDEARVTMRSIAGSGRKYALLWLALFIPGLWNVLHNERLRRGILSRSSRAARLA